MPSLLNLVPRSSIWEAEKKEETLRESMFPLYIFIMSSKEISGRGRPGNEATPFQCLLHHHGGQSVREEGLGKHEATRYNNQHMYIQQNSVKLAPTATCSFVKQLIQ